MTNISDENVGGIQKVKILLVEDNPGHAELVKRNLRNYGVSNEIIHFDDGYKVLDFFESHEFSHCNAKYLMILDLNMPTLGGLDVLRRVKSNTATKSIPVIILTTVDDEDCLEECYEFGCNVFMTKPVEREAFNLAVHELGMFLKVANLRGSRKEERVYVQY